MTGIDRVELAYLKFFLNQDVTFFCLVRTRLGFLLLDRTSANDLLPRLTGTHPWGGGDVWSFLRRRGDPGVLRAEADVRRLAIDTCRSTGLPRLLKRSLPSATTYLNVGHSNLSEDTLSAWKMHGRVIVLIHDTIPLDLPRFQRALSVARFEQKLRAVAQHAEVVLCNSAQTRDDVERWLALWDLPATTVAAPLGVETPNPQKEMSLEFSSGPFFVSVGTIEPRKDHALLLDVWNILQREMANPPHLVIAGQRGWENQAVFDRLDAIRETSTPVHEVNDLSDGALANLVSGARALLFPTRSEGFGLPAAEALLLQTPVLCSDLPVFREILGDLPVYLKSGDVYAWKQSIQELAGSGHSRQAFDQADVRATIPTWSDHFNTVLRVI